MNEVVKCSGGTLGCETVHTFLSATGRNWWRLSVGAFCSLCLTYIGMLAGPWQGQEHCCCSRSYFLPSSCWMLSFRTFSQPMALQK